VRADKEFYAASRHNGHHTAAIICDHPTLDAVRPELCGGGQRCFLAAEYADAGSFCVVRRTTIDGFGCHNFAGAIVPIPET
jgi:hypothetical protein